MFRLYDMNNLNNYPQKQPSPAPVQTPLTMGRRLALSTAPSVSPYVSPSVSPSLLSNSPSLLFFQAPMIANVSQARGGCGSCGGTR
jgi:hypothetical protein